MKSYNTPTVAAGRQKSLSFDSGRLEGLEALDRNKVVTALAYAIVPVLEQKALEAGQAPPPSPFRDALRADCWIWLLVETGIVAVLAVASMVWDRLRSLQNERAQGTIPPAKTDEKPS